MQNINCEPLENRVLLSTAPAVTAGFVANSSVAAYSTTASITDGTDATVAIDFTRTTMGSGTAVTAHYNWDFGDPGSTYNDLPGFNASHAYHLSNPSQSATYTITLTTTNDAGLSSTNRFTLTVNPDTRTPLYISTSGSSSNSGLDAAHPLDLATGEARMTGGHDLDVFFNRGNVFDLSSSSSYNSVNTFYLPYNSVIGAYGTGARPVVEIDTTVATAAHSILGVQNNGSAANVVLNSVKLMTKNLTTTLDAVHVAGTNIVFHDCEFGNVGACINDSLYTNGVVLDHCITDSGSARPGAYLAYINGDNWSVVGARSDTGGAVQDLGEAGLRIQSALHTSFYDNDITQSPNDKPSVKIENPGVNGVPGGDYTYIADNTFPASVVAPLLQLGADTGGGPTLSTAVTTANTVLDGNRMTSESGNAIQMNGGIDQLMARNNYFQSDTIATIWARSGYDTNVWFIHNTQDQTGGQKGVLLTMSVATGTNGLPSAQNVVVQNNLWVDPNLATTPRAAVGIAYPNGTSPTVSQAMGVFSTVGGNVWADDGSGNPNTLQVSTDDSSTFIKQSLSQWNALTQVTQDYAVNVTLDSNLRPTTAGADLDSLNLTAPTDLYGNQRPASSVTAGAVERIVGPVAASGLVASPLNDTAIRLAWTDNSADETGFKVMRSTDGANFTLVATTAADALTYDDAGLAPGTAYYYEIVATNTSGDGSPSNISGTATRVNFSTAPILDDVGSSMTFTDSQGRTWAADNGATGGTTFTNAYTVAGVSSADAPLYYTRREGQSGTSFSYAVPVADGTYSLKLYFAEPNASTPVGSRVFNVTAEGNTVLGSFDIVKDAGAAQTADAKEVRVTVTDGTLNLAFTPVVGDPEVSAIEIDAISPFTSIDVGTPGPGSTTVLTDGSSYNLIGGGAMHGGDTTDAFHFAYQERTGDFDVQTQITSLTNDNAATLAGLMARGDLAPGSANVAIGARPNGGAFRWSYRTADNTATTTPTGGTVSYPNAWVRLQRVGNTFTGYYSSDGVTWTQLGQQVMSLPNTIYFGLMTSSSTTGTSTATFRNLGSHNTATPSTVENYNEANALAAWQASSGPGTTATQSLITGRSGQSGDQAEQLTYTNLVAGGFAETVNAFSSPVDWSMYRAISFWVKGSNTGNSIELILRDNRGTDQTTDTAERFAYTLTDNFTGWKQFVIPWSDFARTSGQPSGAPNDGFTGSQMWGLGFLVTTSLSTSSGSFALDDITLMA